MPLLIRASILTFAMSINAHAAEIIVNVSSSETPGQIGCALFDESQADDFPMTMPPEKVQWHSSSPDTRCHFKDVSPGKYVISVFKDENDNQRVDTSFLGIPKEEWGVSQNVRPTLRAPRFDEAMFVVGEESERIELDIKIKK